MPRNRRIATLGIVIIVMLCAGCADADERAGIAETCSAAVACVPGAECNAEGVCRCETGKVGCGDASCADLATDVENCGACGVHCGAGEACVAGACARAGDGLSTVEEALSVDTPTYVNGGLDCPGPSCPPTTTCTTEFEPVVTYFPGKGYVAGFRDAGKSSTNAQYTSASSWNTWTHSANIPNDVSMHASAGDSWTTYSSLNDRFYVSNIGVNDNPRVDCLAVAAADPDLIGSGQWINKARCPDTTRTGADQPVIAFDDGLRTFYAAYRNAGIRLAFFKNCTTSPGYSGCLKTADNLVGTDTQMFNIDVNPCTNDMVLASRPNEASQPDGHGDQIYLRFFNRDGQIVGSPHIVASGYPWQGNGNNAGCTQGTIRRCNLNTSECGGTPGICLRDNATISMRTKYNSSDGHCYAVMAFDYKSISGTDHQTYVKSAYAVVDITNEAAPVTKHVETSSANANNWNQYNSFVTTNSVNNNVGWFWASDNQGACSVGEEGAVSTNLGLTGMSHINKFSGSFPAIAFGPGAGLQDYAAGVKNGPSGNYLEPVWDQAVPTSGRNANGSLCYQCTVNGVTQSWSDAAKMTRIVP